MGRVCSYNLERQRFGISIFQLSDIVYSGE